MRSDMEFELCGAAFQVAYVGMGKHYQSIVLVNRTDVDKFAARAIVWANMVPYVCKPDEHGAVEVELRTRERVIDEVMAHNGHLDKSLWAGKSTAALSDAYTIMRRKEIF